MITGVNTAENNDTPEDPRILRALHQLDIDWGNGKFDYTKIRNILTTKVSE